MVFYYLFLSISLLGCFDQFKTESFIGTSETQPIQKEDIKEDGTPSTLLQKTITGALGLLSLAGIGLFFRDYLPFTQANKERLIKTSLKNHNFSNLKQYAKRQVDIPSEIIQYPSQLSEIKPYMDSKKGVIAIAKQYTQSDTWKVSCPDSDFSIVYKAYTAQQNKPVSANHLQVVACLLKASEHTYEQNHNWDHLETIEDSLPGRIFLAMYANFNKTGSIANFYNMDYYRRDFITVQKLIQYINANKAGKNAIIHETVMSSLWPEGSKLNDLKTKAEKFSMQQAEKVNPKWENTQDFPAAWEEFQKNPTPENLAHLIVSAQYQHYKTGNFNHLNMLTNDALNTEEKKEFLSIYAYLQLYAGGSYLKSFINAELIFQEIDFETLKRAALGMKAKQPLPTHMIWLLDTYIPNAKYKHYLNSDDADHEDIITIAEKKAQSWGNVSLEKAYENYQAQDTPTNLAILIHAAKSVDFNPTILQENLPTIRFLWTYLYIFKNEVLANLF